jgi:hypothetical protein
MQNLIAAKRNRDALELNVWTATVADTNVQLLGIENGRDIGRHAIFGS